MFMVDGNDNSLWSYIKQDDMVRFPQGNGIFGEVLATDQTIRINDAAKDSRVETSHGEAIGIVARSLVCAPMHDERGQLFGCIHVINKKEISAQVEQDRGFSKHEELIVTDFAHHIGPVVQGWMSFFHHKSGLETELTQAVAGERQMASVISFLLESGGAPLRDTIGEDLAIQLLTAAASVSDANAKKNSLETSPGRQSPVLMMSEAQFAAADTDGDGHLDKNELKAFWGK